MKSFDPLQCDSEEDEDRRQETEEMKNCNPIGGARFSWRSDVATKGKIIQFILYEDEVITFTYWLQQLNIYDIQKKQEIKKNDLLILNNTFIINR